SIRACGRINARDSNRRWMKVRGQVSLNLLSRPRKGLHLKMSRTKSPVSQPAPVGGLIQRRQDAARAYIGNQERSNNWKPLLASAPVGFMDLRSGMCRWPIGDPHHLETFRFCGCTCSPEAIYCWTHKRLASAAHRGPTPPKSRYLQLLAKKVG